MNEKVSFDRKLFHLLRSHYEFYSVKIIKLIIKFKKEE